MDRGEGKHGMIVRGREVERVDLYPFVHGAACERTRGRPLERKPLDLVDAECERRECVRSTDPHLQGGHKKMKEPGKETGSVHQPSFPSPVDSSEPNLLLPTEPLSPPPSIKSLLTILPPPPRTPPNPPPKSPETSDCDSGQSNDVDDENL